MFYVKIKCVAIGKRCLTKSFQVIPKRSLSTKQIGSTTSENSSTNLCQHSGASLDWKQARPFNELPTDNAFKLICKFLPGGRYYNLDSNQLEMTMRKEFGDIFVVPAVLGRPATLVTHNPNDFASVFRNEGIWPIRPFSTLRYHRRKRHADFYQGVEGVLTTQGEQWSSFRSAVNPLLMQPKSILLYLSRMAQVNQEFVDRIRLIRDPNTLEVPANFEDYIQRWLLESVSLVALDKNLGLLREHNENHADGMKMISALNTIFTLGYDLEWKPSLWRRMSTPKFKRVMQAMDDVQNISLKYIDKAIEKLEAEKQQGFERPEHEKSAFEKLLKIDRKVATVMATDLLLGGVNTTTSAVTAILLCLAKDPQKQQRVREEVMQILPQKDGDFTADALNNVPYMRACIKESMRVYPLSVGIVRVTQNDLVLSGYRVPKGTLVNMVATTLLANEKYFPHPLEFLPERWLRSAKGGDENSANSATECVQALKPNNPFIFLPFGFGPRICLGRRISELEMELGIARIVRNFKIEFNYPTANAFKSLFVNLPNIPLKFKFTDIE
ncbi:PREDICTED: probable cytochrome P450 12a5, mitochondrial isoform X1 [Rhagoletis zephyria]|uniref:probable cytochrome P450 12a5, mitochondrial isoform X1 n=1 Tax=Rhagoletis zephyria TaxID=28612 RepID=UPI000811A806|nr:PREDICTED: probable cytochrome P450 12a5, mitochondrial isoform X1 [Rhagoletis zephyria]